MLLAVANGFAQSLPMDFEDPLDDSWIAFNGASSVIVVDPTDVTNSVLELTSVGADFDGSSITLDTYIDLSDASNNTITMRFWTPDATPRTHLLKLEGAGQPAPVAQLYFDTTAAGWQTITLDFSTLTEPDLSNDYPKIVLFADAGNDGVGTYYIDDIDGPNGAAIPPDPVPAVAAPVPNVADAEVYSIYNDTNNFSTVFPVSYAFGTNSGEPDLDSGTAINLALKMNFGIAGWGQGEGGPDDVSAYDVVSFHYWAGAGVNGFDFVLISNSGGVTEHVYQVGVNEPVVVETWVYVEIPMSYFTGIGFANTALFQWKVSPLANSVDNDGIVYFDNILLSQNGLSDNDLVSAEFTVSPNPTNSVWNVKTDNQTIDTVQVFDILGKQVIALAPNATEVSIDASGLNEGIYLVKLTSINGSKIMKLVKN